MITTVDPVTSGLVKSFSRPGANVTGVALLTRELNGKRLELLREVVPRVSSVGVLFGDSPNARTRFHEYEAAAKVLRLHLRPVELKAPEPDFASAREIVAKTGSDAILAIPNSLVNRFMKEIAEIGLKTRLHSIAERNDYVEAGSLLSYSASSAEVYRRAAMYVDKILKGAKPAELPIEQPTKFELVINLKTAKQIGLTIPPNVLARADRVIK
jgi:putative ABC transport system substrate-binding protein